MSPGCSGSMSPGRSHPMSLWLAGRRGPDRTGRPSLRNGISGELLNHPRRIKKAPGKYEVLGGRRTTRLFSGSRWLVFDAVVTSLPLAVSNAIDRPRHPSSARILADIKVLVQTDSRTSEEERSNLPNPLQTNLYCSAKGVLRKSFPRRLLGMSGKIGQRHRQGQVGSPTKLDLVWFTRISPRICVYFELKILWPRQAFVSPGQPSHSIRCSHSVAIASINFRHGVRSASHS